MSAPTQPKANQAVENQPDNSQVVSEPTTEVGSSEKSEAGQVLPESSTAPNPDGIKGQTKEQVEILPTVTEEANATKWVVIIVVLLLLIISLAGSAFYYLTQYKFTPKSKELVSPEVSLNVTPSVEPTKVGNQSEASPSAVPTLSSSDELKDIKADLEKTDTLNIEQELTQIEKSL